MNNSFINQFSENIKFNYTCFDRVIIRGYILKFFSLACVVLFLRAMGFSRKSNTGYFTELKFRATDKELRADGNIYAGAIPGCFIIELMAQLAHQLAP